MYMYDYGSMQVTCTIPFEVARPGGREISLNLETGILTRFIVLGRVQIRRFFEGDERRELCDEEVVEDSERDEGEAEGSIASSTVIGG